MKCKRLARVSNDYITQLKYMIKDYLTTCPIKLSSEKFREELFKFLYDKGIKNVYDIKVSKTSVIFYFDIDELVYTSIWVPKELFE